MITFRHKSVGNLFFKKFTPKTWKFNESYDNSLVYFASSRDPSIQRCVHILSQLSVSKKRYTPEKKHKFVLEELASWIDCLGDWVRIHPQVLYSFEAHSSTSSTVFSWIEPDNCSLVHELLCWQQDVATPRWGLIVARNSVQKHHSSQCNYFFSFFTWFAFVWNT